MQDRKDFYQLLGVRRDASAAAIRRAFLRLSRELATMEAASDGFEAVQRAYETLSDHERRRRYDETLKVGEVDRSAVAWSLLKHPDGRELKRPMEPGSLSAEIFLSPAEARAGGIVTLEVPIPATCPDCRGTGGAAFSCAACDGEGVTHHRMPVPLRVPAGSNSGTVFQVRLDEPLVSTLLLTVHTRTV